ncbi:IS66 family insertion sequence element accessory protein TnpB, partial [Vibrio astriarenae]
DCHQMTTKDSIFRSLRVYRVLGSYQSGALFLFTNKQRDKIKVLYWDKTGFALWYKRLEKAKYKWPTKEKSEVFTLTQFELDRLLSGFTIIGHKPVRINDFTMT